MPSNQRPTHQNSSPLAAPFSRIFIDRAEANWVFDFLRDTVKRLQTTAYDPRLAVTLSERSGRLHLRLNFGSWLVVGFRGPGQVPERVDLALLAQTINWDERLAGFAFERKEGQPEVRSYHLPLNVVRPLTTSLRRGYETTLDFIAEKFQNWKKATHWKQHNPEIVEAFFDPDRRQRLFTDGLADFELVYGRQYTAFGQELVVAEEGVGYGVEEAKVEDAEDTITNTNEVKQVEREKLAEKLKNAFKQFKHSFYDQCVVKLRRSRIAQLRDLLSDPDKINVHIFNQEVWNIHNSVTFNDAIVDIFNRDDFTVEQLSQIEMAITSDNFKVDGNSIWGSGSRVYAPRLGDEAEKTNYIRQALHILNDAKLSPLEKIKNMKAIYGFGDNISTGLVMVFHPDKFSLYNREAKKILNGLGYGNDISLEKYQKIVNRLKVDLEAQDYVELDWFLYRINQGAYSNFFNNLDQITVENNDQLKLIEPFSQIFTTLAEAKWGFDFLAETCGRLGINEANDERLTITLVERYGGLSLHFNFADWLILGFRPPDLAHKRVRLPLLVDQAPFGKSFIEYEFEQPPTEAPIVAYGLPLDKVQNWPDNLQSVYIETLQQIKHRFETTAPSPRSPHHRPDIAQAIFTPTARLPLLTQDPTPQPSPTHSPPPTPHLPTSDPQSPISNPQSPSPKPPYPPSPLLPETGLSQAELNRWLRAIERKKQIILYGPPGTGKTFVAEKLAQHLIAAGDGLTEFVQFHPAYAYEDFIQGLRPEALPDGRLNYALQPGRFLEFCHRARTRQDTCVLIIDEINRANLARVLGELMVLLEYRDKTIPLAGGGQLTIPANVRLIGTMNTADRSIALVDHALRRRFAFIALRPNFDILRHYHHKHQTDFPVERLITLLNRLNRRIDDAHYEMGITYFLHQNLADDIEDIWRMEIEPYLEEFFFDQPDSVTEFRWQKIKQEVFGAG